MLLILWKLNNIQMMLMSRLLQPKILLVFICVLFLITHLYKIGEIPPSLYWDESSIGYNAYSIAQTGKDEWVDFLPIHFRAFGEFKLPVYIYATVPFVAVFGLTAFSVRLPAVLFSLGVIILTYFLSNKIWRSKTIGLFSSFFVSVSPWFFIFSRTGYEATAGLMFYLLGVLLFLQKQNGKIFLLSMISLILSFYSYNTFRIISPLTFLILTLYKKNEIKSVLKKDLIYSILAVVLLLLSLIPIYRLYRYDSGIFRLQAVSTTSSTFFKNYLSHFSPDFLILYGDKNLRIQQEDFGQIYLPELILFLLGFIYIIGRKSKFSFLALFLLLIGPIPAAITKESPHALRAISMIPFISIISAQGVHNLGKIVKKRYIFNLTIITIFFGFFINYFLNFLDTYPIKASKDWQYGYKKIFKDFKDDFSKYDRVIISDEYAQQYIFALFYQKIDPEIFRQTLLRNSVDRWGFSTVSKFDKFEFGKVSKLLEKDSKITLIFASAEEPILNLNPSNIINFPDGRIAFRVYKLR